MFNIKDLVKFKTLENPMMFGKIVEVLRIESSTFEKRNGMITYGIEPIDQRLAIQFILEEDIIECYSKYYEQNV